MPEDANPNQPDNPKDPNDPPNPFNDDISKDLHSLAKGLMVDFMWTVTGLKRKIDSRQSDNPEDKPDESR